MRPIAVRAKGSRAATVRAVVIEQVRSFFSIPAASPPQRIRAWPVLLAVCIAIGTIAEAVLADWPEGVETLIASLLVGGLVLVPASRISEVLAGLVVISVTAALVSFLRGTDPDYSYAASIAVLRILYHVGRWAVARTILYALIFAGVVVPLAEFWLDVNETTWEVALADSGFNILLIGTGLLIRSSAATRLEAARADVAEQQRHFANEIHDSVAHHMSAIAVRAEAARQFAVSPEAESALADIKNSAALGLTDLRQLLVTMRSGESPTRSRPRLDDLHQLAAQAGGVPVTIEIDSKVGSVSPSVAAVIHAIAREGLTNVRRHAHDASGATIRVHRDKAMVVLEVEDDGEKKGSTSTPGNGIQSMTDRASSVRGSLVAGERSPHGWLVTATLPAKGQESR